MKNETQLERYKRLLTHLDEKFKEEINIEKVEEVSHYSYRNINRIFQALHHETIGKYVKRIRLEKAAQYLKHSDENVSDIAFEIGFEDIAAFSKAFKNKYDCSPSAFRSSNESIRKITQQAISPEEVDRTKIPFEIEYLHDFEFLSLEYRGSYEDISAIKEMWEQLLNYAAKREVLTSDSIFMAEILDDNDISESIHCRYNLAIILDKPLPFEPEGLFKTQLHKRQKYAKFIHKGSHETCADTYNKIYAFWIVDVKLEMEDLPILEFYLNDEEDTPPEELLTEIYIPIK